MLVLAGPGSGKTSVLISHIQQLINDHHVPPDTILVVTFTRAAAKEMRERYLKLSEKRTSAVTFSTLHGIFYAILRGSKETAGQRILEGKEKRRILSALLLKAGEDRNDDPEFLDSLEKEISQAKKAEESGKEFLPKILEKQVFKSVYEGYETILKKENGMDFDDLAAKVFRLFKEQPAICRRWQNRFSFVLVDEFQDIDMEQYELLKILASPQNHLFMVGDDDQSIYGFRGADPKVMLRVPEDFKDLETVRLEINYRCDRKIVELSDRLIRQNTVRFEKKIRPAKETEGEILYLCAKDRRNAYKNIGKEIKKELLAGCDPSEICVLTRTNAGAGLIGQYLSGQNILCENGKKTRQLKDHFIWEDIRAYIKIAMGDRHRENFLRIMNRPFRGIDRQVFFDESVDPNRILSRGYVNEGIRQQMFTFFEQLQLLSGLLPFAFLDCLETYVGYGAYLKELAARQGVDVIEYAAVLDALRQVAAGKKSLEAFVFAVEHMSRPADDGGIHVMTMHRAKGLEFDVVCIPDINEDVIPVNTDGKPEEIEEERRLFYVAVTRARRKLVLSAVDNKERKQVPSRFLSDAGL